MSLHWNAQQIHLLAQGAKQRPQEHHAHPKAGWQPIALFACYQDALMTADMSQKPLMATFG
jgi:hypothetical protein